MMPGTFLPDWIAEWMKCPSCDVMWLREASLDCWFCGQPGEVSNIPQIRGGYWFTPEPEEEQDVA